MTATAEEKKQKRQIGIAFHALMITVALGVFWLLYINHQWTFLIVYLALIVTFNIFHLHYVFTERRIEKSKE